MATTDKYIFDNQPFGNKLEVQRYISNQLKLMEELVKPGDALFGMLYELLLLNSKHAPDKHLNTNIQCIKYFYTTLNEYNTRVYYVAYHSSRPAVNVITTYVNLTKVSKKK
jgi:RNAse (barnase) inhibitor barstar